MAPPKDMQRRGQDRDPESQHVNVDAKGQYFAKQSEEVGYGENPGVGAPDLHVEDYLMTVEYPCSTDDIIEQAESHDAPEQVLEILRELPNRTYEHIGEVAQEIGQLH